MKEIVEQHTHSWPLPQEILLGTYEIRFVCLQELTYSVLLLTSGLRLQPDSKFNEISNATLVVCLSLTNCSNNRCCISNCCCYCAICCCAICRVSSSNACSIELCAIDGDGPCVVLPWEGPSIVVSVCAACILSSWSAKASIHFSRSATTGRLIH